MSLVDQIATYSKWRDSVVDQLGRLRLWLERNDVSDTHANLRLRYVEERLQSTKLRVAFVAEFSRGKSELINAIFFSGFGDRILPSSAGRTTMCPTELQWSEGALPQIRLLPINSRKERLSFMELKQHEDLWTIESLDSHSLDGLQQALSRVSEVERVASKEAIELGFSIDEQGQSGLKPDDNDEVEIPRWRHAVIQFPHPLLEQGLVVLDTPGLNAIGAEPELTFSLLPSADAVLFILAADTGVTQSDLEVWREHVQTGRSNSTGRLVVLNKIDSLWDGLRGETRIEAEISKQVNSVADMLDVPSDIIFPLSAQKGLVGRIQGNDALVKQSRLPVFEQALSQDLLPTKRRIVTETTLDDSHEIIQKARDLLSTRLKGISEQGKEITELRGKNQSVIEYMMRKIRSEKTEFEQGLQKYYAVRSVFSDLTNNLLGHLGLDALRHETQRTREAMLRSTFTPELRQAMRNFFHQLRSSLEKSSVEIDEIMTMLDTMYRRFSVEHGLKLTQPEPFSTLRYEKELDRLEELFNSQINSTLKVYSTAKKTVTEKFFETVAIQARRTFELANHDVEHWLRAVMSPLETQVREYQLQLKDRLESVKRIHQATGTLEDRIEELSISRNALKSQLEELRAIEANLLDALGVDHEQALAYVQGRSSTLTITDQAA